MRKIVIRMLCDLESRNERVAVLCGSEQHVPVIGEWISREKSAGISAMTVSGNLTERKLTGSNRILYSATYCVEMFIFNKLIFYV